MSSTRSPKRASDNVYAGAMPALVGAVPAPIRGPLIEAGGMARLFGKISVSAVRQPRGYWGNVLDDMHRTIKQAWLPVSAAIFGFLMFVSILTVIFFDMSGAVPLFPPMLFLHAVRTFTIWVVSMVVAGVIGAAATADIGARKVREELDAMQVMGIDPVRELALPKVISITFVTTLLTMPSLFVTGFSMQLGARYVAHVPSAEFYHNLFDNLDPKDVLGLVINGFLVGLLIAVVCCYKGLNAGGGAIGLGRAVNQAVVTSFVGIWILELGYQALLLGLFPELGSFR